MSNVSKGHNFEREVKKMFTEAGWFCTRAAASQSPMDLIAYTRSGRMDYGDVLYPACYKLYRAEGKFLEWFEWRWTKQEDRNTKTVYTAYTRGANLSVVLMQCKIKKRRHRAKAR
jgi:hypothetical protein